eukprot:TRINITY_DN6365_c0_g1_i1.p1 TRINITY_DN6365_c0_g1~~TRINITY_DN6365_c0_g1_i1.p1  ORF type:complete len:402 (+),score=75.50 TRINITY_DN6365_c0_g1_i1:124-1206(+)
MAVLVAYNESKAPAALGWRSWLATSLLPAINLLKPTPARHTLDFADTAAVQQARLGFDRVSMVPLYLFGQAGRYSHVSTLDAMIGGRVPITVYSTGATSWEASGDSMNLRWLKRTTTITTTVVFIHGGGFAFGSRATHDHICRRLAHDLGNHLAIISIEYRLSPEHPYPAGLEDVVSVARAVAKAISSSTKLILAGDSAGGNLATAALLQLHGSRVADDQTVAQRVTGQLLIYPAVHLSCMHCYASIARYGQGYFLSAADKAWFARAYLGGNESRGREPAVSPMTAADAALGKMPSTMVVLAEADILHDEGQAYAHRLQSQGVAVTLKSYAGTIHGFFTHGLDQHDEAVADAAAWVRTLQ